MPAPVVWEHTIDLDGPPEGVLIRPPIGAGFLGAAPREPDDGTAIDTWWQAYPDAAPGRVVLHLVSTGNAIPAGAHEYLASVRTPYRREAVHLFRQDPATGRVFVLGGRGNTHTQVRTAPWFRPGQRVIRGDLRGRLFDLADVIVVPHGFDLDALEARDDVAHAARCLPHDVTVRDLIEEVG